MKCEEFFEILEKNDLTFFTGVPDSTFKGFLNFLDYFSGSKLKNIIACNECEAVAIAAGYHLATGKTGIVYMQNAGLGKAVNPLTSLCDKEVYSIPLIMLIGWRGKPGEKDEPQHKKMGRITAQLLETLEVPFEILPGGKEEAEKIVQKIKKTAIENSIPTAIIIERGTIDDFKPSKSGNSSYELEREEALCIVAENASDSDIIISTTGKISRELYEFRTTKKQIPGDFYTVGSMGCSVSIALGIAMKKPDKKVFVFDGDGAVLMQMGALSTVGHYKPNNFFHIIFDNESYDSTGGQPANSKNVNFDAVALNCGYKYARTILSRNELLEVLKDIREREGPVLINIKVKKGSRENLGRPTSSPLENKKSFMKKISL